MQNRFKSKTLWVAISSVILMLLSHFGLLDKLGITEQMYKDSIDSVLGILVILGIINNPNEKGVV
jgi:uncharacterized membrane protein